MSKIRDKIRYRTHDWKHTLARWLAWKIPHRLAYWVFIRVAVHNYKDYPGDRTVRHALSTWEADRT